MEKVPSVTPKTEIIAMNYRHRADQIRAQLEEPATTQPEARLGFIAGKLSGLITGDKPRNMNAGTLEEELAQLESDIVILKGQPDSDRANELVENYEFIDPPNLYGYGV